MNRKKSPAETHVFNVGLFLHNAILSQDLSTCAECGEHVLSFPVAPHGSSQK